MCVERKEEDQKKCEEPELIIGSFAFASFLSALVQGRRFYLFPPGVQKGKI